MSSHSPASIQSQQNTQQQGINWQAFTELLRHPKASPAFIKFAVNTLLTLLAQRAKAMQAMAEASSRAAIPLDVASNIVTSIAPIPEELRQMYSAYLLNQAIRGLQGGTVPAQSAGSNISAKDLVNMFRAQAMQGE